MNRVKRWTMTMTSWVDGVLAQIENHEANVDAAIVRVRKSTGRARFESNEAKSLLGNLSILRFLQSRAIDTFLISLASTSTYTIFGFSVPNGFSTNLCRPDESVSRRGVLPSNFFPS
jgi:hypothetical protein